MTVHSASSALRTVHSNSYLYNNTFFSTESDNIFFYWIGKYIISIESTVYFFPLNRYIFSTESVYFSPMNQTVYFFPLNQTVHFLPIETDKIFFPLNQTGTSVSFFSNLVEHTNSPGLHWRHDGDRDGCSREHCWLAVDCQQNAHWL